MVTARGARAHLRVGVAVVYVTFVVAVACNRQQQRPNVGDMHRRTARDGATVSALSEPQRTASGVPYTWNVQSPKTWEEYRALVTDEFRQDFKVVRSDTSALVLSRTDNGNVYRLEFHVTREADGTDLHVIYSASAG
jgi:hypothetical protein